MTKEQQARNAKKFAVETMGEILNNQSNKKEIMSNIEEFFGLVYYCNVDDWDHIEEPIIYFRENGKTKYLDGTFTPSDIIRHRSKYLIRYSYMLEIMERIKRRNINSKKRYIAQIFNLSQNFTKDLL